LRGKGLGHWGRRKVRRFFRTYLDLLNDLKGKGVIRDSRVFDVMSRVDRKNYCPSDMAYYDTPVSIGNGQTISAPHMHAFALQELSSRLIEGSMSLDVGSGSGYLLSCMAYMVLLVKVVCIELEGWKQRESLWIRTIPSASNNDER